MTTFAKLANCVNLAIPKNAGVAEKPNGQITDPLAKPAKELVLSM